MANAGQQRTIDALPPLHRQRVIDMLIAGRPSREVSAYLAEHGIKLSYAACARYKRDAIAPALRVGRSIAKNQAPAASPGELARQTADITRAVIEADPIVARAKWLWNEVETGIEESKERWEPDPERPGKQRLVSSADLKARASLLGTGVKVAELEARAMQHPGWAPAAAPAGATTIQIALVLPQSQSQPAAGVAIPAAETPIIDAGCTAVEITPARR